MEFQKSLDILKESKWSYQNVRMSNNSRETHMIFSSEIANCDGIRKKSEWKLNGFGRFESVQKKSEWYILNL